MSNDAPTVENDAQTPRREFLKRTTILAGGAGLLMLPAWSRNAFAAINNPGHAAASFAVEIDGQLAGYVKSFEGGIAHGDVVEVVLGNQSGVKKHIGPPKYDEFQIQVGSTSGALFEWVTGILDGRSVAKNGAVLTLDHNYTEQRRINFNGAYPTELTIPALEAGARDAGHLAVKFQPERTQMPVAKPGAPRPGGPSRQEKPWLRGNFQLKIAGLEQACAYVTRIDALTVRQPIATATTGQERYRESTPGKVEYSNLVIYLAENRADPFFKWFEEFVVRGNNGEANERTGSLEFVDATGRGVQLRFNFFNIGIAGCRLEGRSAAADAAPLVRIEMYFERMSLGSAEGKAAAAAPVKRDGGVGSGSVGMDVLKGFNQ